MNPPELFSIRQIGSRCPFDFSRKERLQVIFEYQQRCRKIAALKLPDGLDEDGWMRRHWKRIVAGMTPALLAAIVPLSAQVAKPDAAAADPAKAPKVVLVELFTSEGCSSCPPADALLRQIDGKHAAGQLIVGISEHVTYWNSEGWSDPFSSSIYTDRQNAYGEKFHLDSVYTPQMVINGTQQVLGSDYAAVTRAIQKESEQPARVTLQILSTSVVENKLTVKFSAVGDASSQKADVVAVLADDADQSSVLRGENSGRTLAHVSVARSLAWVAKVRTAAEQTVEIPVPKSFKGSQGHHLILFVQAAGNGRVLAVDTKPL
jgi:hypothetical protein